MTNQTSGIFAELFILALLGHLIGDFLLQSKKMALGKSVKGWGGFWTCTFHVFTYTMSVATLLSAASHVTFWCGLFIFIPHWIIDRWSLASVWLKAMRGRTFEAAYSSKDSYREFDIAFTAIVYTVVDNTLHLLSLWAVIILFLI